MGFQGPELRFEPLTRAAPGQPSRSLLLGLGCATVAPSHGLRPRTQGTSSPRSHSRSRAPQPLFATPLHESFAMSTLRPRNQACGTAFRAFSFVVWAGRPACGPRPAMAQRRPAGRLPARPQALPDHLDQLAGEHRQAQVARAVRGPAVVDRARSQCAPEGAEDGLQVGPRHAGAPQPLGVPADAAGAQAVDPGMGRPAALQRLPLPGHRRRVAAPVVRLHVDRAVRGGGRMAGLQPSDALPDLLHAPGRALARQTLVQRPQSRLEARAGLPRHRPLLLRPLRGRAAQARLAVPVRLGAGQHTLPAGGADDHRPARIEDAPPLAQPGDVPLRGASSWNGRGGPAAAGPPRLRSTCWSGRAG